jgi:hypothetical protein
MRHKKLKLSVLLLLVFGLTGLQAQQMYVKEKGGKQSSYLLTDIRKMSFSSGNIAIQKINGSSDQFSMSGLRYLNFTDLSVGIAPLAETSREINLQVYPNPVVDVLNIKLKTAVTQPGIIEILSLVGKVVYVEKINGHSDIYQINASSLAKGLYLCRITNGTIIETIKFIKQ